MTEYTISEDRKLLALGNSHIRLHEPISMCDLDLKLLIDTCVRHGYLARMQETEVCLRELLKGIIK